MRRRKFSLYLALASVVAAVGCVRPGAVPPAAGSHYVITEAELANAPEISLYEAVARLRPHFLKSRTITAEGKPASWPIMLYVDGERMESLDDLRRVPIPEVREVRFYEPQIANTRFAGYNNAGGAIAVTTKNSG